MTRTATAEPQVEILLVEDDANDAELLLRGLKKNRLANKVHWVKDGEEAVDLLFGRGTYAGRDLRGGPKVVLLDIQLPKKDGFEVLRQIKADPRTRALPVVILTSSREEGDKVRSFDLGASHYAVKPLDFEQFSKTAAELGFEWMLVRPSEPS